MWRHAEIHGASRASWLWDGRKPKPDFVCLDGDGRVGNRPAVAPLAHADSPASPRNDINYQLRWRLQNDREGFQCIDCAYSRIIPKIDSIPFRNTS